MTPAAKKAPRTTSRHAPKHKTPKRSKAAQRAETLEKILNAAELLFSQHGLYGVTLKDVAREIGVQAPLIHYYFDNKQSLFDAVFSRRAAVSSAIRMAALDHYEQQCGGHPTVEGALHAFLDTDLDNYISGGEGWRNYAALGAQVSNTPVWGAETMSRHFDPVVRRLLGILQRALPECSQEDIFWGYHFVTGAFTLTAARTGRIDILSGGRCKSDDFAAIKARMASFMTGGFLTLRDRARLAARRPATAGKPGRRKKAPAPSGA